MSEASHSVRPGRLFTVLWAFTVIVELVSLQLRLAIFGGTGWLTSVKFTTFGSRLEFILVLAILCAALCSIWTLVFYGLERIFKSKNGKISRLSATLWLCIIVIDLIFRHKVGEILGGAFDFFDFATGVGGVWRMIVQAFQWYSDIIILSILGVLAFAVVTWLFFKWLFKPREKEPLLNKIPTPIFAAFTAVMFIAGLCLVTNFSPTTPQVQTVMIQETMFGSAFNQIVNKTTDFDGDGYGAFDHPADADNSDNSIHPHALDIPNDGIDQDQLMGDLNPETIPPQLKQRVEQYGKSFSTPPKDRRHVILVIMESVRYDMLDAQIHNEPVMPNMKAFIDRGAIRVDGAFASRGFTQNSVTQTFWGSFFDPGTSLVDDFKSLGYHTAVFNGESLKDESFDESCGWNRAGDTIVDPRNIEANIYHHQSVPALMLMDEVEKFLDGYDASKPLFLYTFYQDPHFPYQQDNPPVLTDREIERSEIAAKTRPRLWQSYANQVHHLDKAAGRLIQALDKKEMLDNSLVIFISDHGESLFDDGYLLGHGIAIQDTMTHAVMTIWGAHHDIPSMISHPDIRGFIHDDFLAEPKKPEIVSTGNPVLQFIGATTVPSAISHRYEDGSRVTWDFATQSAWMEDTADRLKTGEIRMAMPQHGDVPIDQKIDINEALQPTNIRRADIPNPFEDSRVKTLIQEWEYMQWFHRK